MRKIPHFDHLKAFDDVIMWTNSVHLIKKDQVWEKIPWLIVLGFAAYLCMAKAVLDVFKVVTYDLKSIKQYLCPFTLSFGSTISYPCF